MESLRVLLIGLDETSRDELALEDDLEISTAADLGALEQRIDVDAVVLGLDGLQPLEALEAVRSAVPRAGLVVITPPSREADGAIAFRAGAEETLVAGRMPSGLLARAVRYAAEVHRLRRELATTDEASGLPNLRGFAPIAEHHLRMADRSREPVVFLFVRLDRFHEARARGDAEDLVRDAAGVLLEALRTADVPARISDDTFCVLLSGDARGAETLVLSRLVEAIAVHDTRLDEPRPLSLAVGSALYDPAVPASLEQILAAADRRLAAPEESSDRR